MAIHTKENVGLGLLFSLGAVAIGVLSYLLLSQAGFIASITSYLMVYLGVRLYFKGAKSLPIKGFYWFIALMLLGIFLSIFGSIVADGLKSYNHYSPEFIRPISRMEYLQTGLSRAVVWKSYTSRILLSLAFGGLGIYGTFMRLLVVRRAHAARAKTSA